MVAGGVIKVGNQFAVLRAGTSRAPLIGRAQAFDRREFSAIAFGFPHETSLQKSDSPCVVSYNDFYILVTPQRCANLPLPQKILRHRSETINQFALIVPSLRSS